jgi:hypothetical protein
MKESTADLEGAVPQRREEHCGNGVKNAIESEADGGLSSSFYPTFRHRAVEALTLPDTPISIILKKEPERQRLP